MELLTIREAAEITRMSQSWWRQKIFRNEIHYLKIGRSVRIPRSTVDEILRKAERFPRLRSSESS